jgi:hypothetical protein
MSNKIILRVSFLSIAKIFLLTRKDLSFTMQFLEQHRRQVLI